ncbi:leucyl/phenylalanyl-tRNA--protein transferase [Psychromonas sp. psych-6C06]|uniref:leucyl/phenylalanyl-tRNA--protein transferase n=1 Tax=Psychromonas sp. psych-6C06 TaxID=2058089 RepID=UPI000C328F7E|nr:leucyl/phenylalanyl-tRNA--protein transferase [Psychromonas sp. psych-6C06]PKF60425.1 leucyl/phenylalanyl-tRNA--protein transferase [Psychromonas sp. psych-6C06]
MTIYLPQLSDDVQFFPPVDKALKDPDGLLAMGGDLSTDRIVNAYRSGIFPWFSAGEPLLWWSPSERATMKAGDVHISRSMKRFINKQSMTITVNHCFEKVIRACALPRATQSETWILDEMIEAYISLHKFGHAHSIEVWCSGILVGGLYGVCIGQTFCGESMFSQKDNSSKLAFIALNQHFKAFNGKIIDCQMQTDHLQRLGVTTISRTEFINKLLQTKNALLKPGCWDKQPISIQTN